MVMFGLFGVKKPTSNDNIPSRPPALIDKEIDVLDDLMDLDNYKRVTDDKNTSIDLNTSSFNLDDIINRISTKNSDQNIDYKNALINSLYSQVDHLRGESIRKDTIIKHLIQNSEVNPLMSSSSTSSCDSCTSSSVEVISEISNPQENPFFNDYGNLSANGINNNDNNSSLYSDISSTSFITPTSDENTSTKKCESYDRQLANYRYKNHWDFIKNKREPNDSLQATNSQQNQTHNKRFKIIKETLERIKNNPKSIEVNTACKSSKVDIDVPSDCDDIIKGNNIKHYIENDALHVYENEVDPSILWKKGTTLIVGDSMLNGLDETRLKNCKVRAYGGSSIEDLHYNLVPLLRKRPSTIILHTGTNNSTRDNSAQIIEKLINLKEFITSHSPHVKIIISSLIQRYDDSKAQLTSDITNTKLNSVGVDIIDNNNITRKHLGKKGHHMTPYGTGRLAMNIINKLKSL